MNLIIIGAGGFAREMFDLAIICNSTNPDFNIKGFLSDGPSNIQEMGYPPVLGKVNEYVIQEDDYFFCAIGNLVDRMKTVNIILDKGGKFINLIHPIAIISPSVRLGIGIGIKAFCVLSSDVEIDDFTFMQSSVIMGHDVKIGKFCQINSFAFLAGDCLVGNSVSINAGAKLIQKITVGDNATVGIGSVVLRKVKAGTTVFGNPAKQVG